MHKILKISLITGASIALLLILTAFILPPVAKWYVVKHSKELTGRVMTIEKLRFNMFTGALRVVKFDMKEQNDTDSFVHFDTLLVKMNLFDLLRHRVTVNKIHTTDLVVNTWQNGALFNFTDLMQRFNAPDSTAAPKDSTATPWAIAINDIEFRRGYIHYVDRAINGQWNMDDVNLKIPGVYFSGKATDVGFTLAFRDGGSLASSLKYDIEQSAFRIHLDLEKFTLKGLLPYFQQNMRLGSLAGFLEAHVDIDGDMNHIMSAIVKGTATVTDFDMKDDRDRLVLAADSLFVDMASISLAESDYRLNEFTTRGLATLYEMEKDSTTNFTYLMKPGPAKQQQADSLNAAGASMHLHIAKIDMRKSNIEIRDQSLQQPFTYALSDVRLKAEDFNPDKHNSVNIRGNVGKSGKAVLQWNGNINDLSNLKLKIDFHNLDIREFTPYSLEYTAYPLSNGHMSFASHNVVNNNMLKGVNNLSVVKCEVDKKRKDIKPEMQVPLRLGLYILKDRNGEIKMDLPVEGDIKSPAFSYKKIIIKTVVNLLVKVALTPFDFIAGALGLNPDQLSEMPYLSTQYDLTDAQYDQLNKLVEILQAKPELMLTMQQYVNMEESVKDISLANLKRDYYLSTRPDEKRQSLDLMDQQNYLQISNGDPQLQDFAAAIVKDSLPLNADIYTKAIAVYKERANRQIAMFAARRNKQMMDYMLNKLTSPERIRVEMAPADSVYTGKNIFKASLGLPEEAPVLLPVPAADSTASVDTTLAK